MSIAEIVGYAASILVAISLTMSNIWKLRWINLLGAVIFSIYGIWVGAYPVLAVNSFIAVVNVYYIIQLSKRKDYFSYIEYDNPKDPLLSKFLEFYSKDIKKFFPDFRAESLNNAHYHIILRNLVPVGIFVCEFHENGVVEVALDYVIPDYRDLKNANFIYSEKAQQLYKNGFKSFTASSQISVHQGYLKKVGYIQDEHQKDLFRKEILAGL